MPGTVPGSQGIHDKQEIKDTIPNLIGEADINQINNSAIVWMCYGEDAHRAVKENNKGKWTSPKYQGRFVHAKDPWASTQKMRNMNSVKWKEGWRWEIIPGKGNRYSKA